MARKRYVKKRNYPFPPGKFSIVVGLALGILGYFLETDPPTYFLFLAPLIGLIMVTPIVYIVYCLPFEIYWESKRLNQKKIDDKEKIKKQNKLNNKSKNKSNKKSENENDNNLINAAIFTIAFAILIIIFRESFYTRGEVTLLDVLLSLPLGFMFTLFISVLFFDAGEITWPIDNTIKINSNHIIIILLLIIIAGGGYFLSQDRQSNTEIRYIPKIIKQYVPSFNFPPFTGGSSGTKYKAPGDTMIENGLKLLSPETNKSKPILTKVCVKKTAGGQVSKTVSLAAMCPFGYKEIGK